MDVKTAQVWRESKIAREMLRFTTETAVGGREGRRCRTGGCGAVAAMFALCSREFPMAGGFRGRGKESNVRRMIGECNCRLPDALAGGFRGRGKESNVRHIIGECIYRFLDALAGEFRGRGKESNARHIIGECNCRLLDALAGEFIGREKERFE